MWAAIVNNKIQIWLTFVNRAREINVHSKNGFLYSVNMYLHYGLSGFFIC